jgi:hypothetical protein
VPIDDVSDFAPAAKARCSQESDCLTERQTKGHSILAVMVDGANYIRRNEFLPGPTGGAFKFVV